MIQGWYLFIDNMLTFYSQNFILLFQVCSYCFRNILFRDSLETFLEFFMTQNSKNVTGGTETRKKIFPLEPL